MIEVGGESNGEQPGTDHESLQSTTPAVASLLQATQASGDLLAHSQGPSGFVEKWALWSVASQELEAGWSWGY
ncbi:hypothetical protein MRX96_018443 [Rhipicephalus microplus]